MAELVQKRLWKNSWRKFNETAGINFIWQTYPPPRASIDIQAASTETAATECFLLDTKTGYWYPTTEPLESLNLKARYDKKSYLLSAIRRELQKKGRLYINERIFNEISRILQAKSILVARATKIELT